jgi:ribosomal protein L20
MCQCHTSYNTGKQAGGRANEKKWRDRFLMKRDSKKFWGSGASPARVGSSSSNPAYEF